MAAAHEGDQGIDRHRGGGGGGVLHPGVLELNLPGEDERGVEEDPAQAGLAVGAEGAGGRGRCAALCFEHEDTACSDDIAAEFSATQMTVPGPVVPHPQGAPFGIERRGACQTEVFRRGCEGGTAC